MCGIVGFITDEKSSGAYERKKFFINALLAGVVRGDDGTGAFFVPHDHEGSADWCKQGAPASDFLAAEKTLERVGYGKSFDKYRAVIGHNRSATVGKVSTSNAHPFQEGPITLVHNGTLHTTWELPKGKTDLKGVDVDSHVITHNLATHDAEEVIAKLDGAFTLIWHDARDQSVNIIRNDKRPLHIMPVTCEKTLLIASEAEMLAWLVARSGFKAGPIYYPDPGLFMKFTKEHGIKPVVKKVSLYEPRYGRGGYYGRGGANYSGWQGGYDDYDDDHPWYNGRGRAYSAAGTGNAGDSSGKAPTSETGATTRHSMKLPTKVRKLLDTVALMPEDKLRFTVVGIQHVLGTGFANVIGRLVDLNRPGIIHGMKLLDAEDSLGQTWTVNPIVPKVLSGYGGSGKAELLVCALNSKRVTFTTEPLPSSALSPDEADDTTDEEADELDYTDVPFLDANGDEMTYDQWFAKVQCGCIYCKELPDPEFADDMLWDKETGEPICADCRWDLESGTHPQEMFV